MATDPVAAPAKGGKCKSWKATAIVLAAVRSQLGASYTIKQLLPAESDDFQYKIKSAAEPHERVAKESQLNRAT